MALFLGIGVVTVLGAGPAPTLALAREGDVRCVDCDGQSCWPVRHPGAREGRCTPEGCVAWGDCR